MERVKGGVTAAKGFLAAGIEASIKYKNRKDMALIYSEEPCITAGTFTSNVVKAAPVLWDREIIASSPYTRAVVINAGIANACTGNEGMEHCKGMAWEAAKALGMEENCVLVASTGVIGMKLPMERIKEGIHRLAGEKKGGIQAGEDAACAIMTTDTHPKQAAVSFLIGDKTVTVGGMCKGSGMIHPDMCTMLSFVTTDASISKEMLTKAVKEDVKDTYNMISVDGDTSTNDTLLVMANAAAGNQEITCEGEDYFKFKEALHHVNETLAKMMAADGEGATALFEVEVRGAGTKEEARKLGKSVICSSLTKAAIFGHDANWGRILCALGYAGVDFEPDKVEVEFEAKKLPEGFPEKSEGEGERREPKGELAKPILIYKNGEGCDYSEEKAARLLSNPYVCVRVNMNMGTESAVAWGCDLTYDYVKINADYRS